MEGLAERTSGVRGYGERTCRTANPETWWFKGRLSDHYPLRNLEPMPSCDFSSPGTVYVGVDVKGNPTAYRVNGSESNVQASTQPSDVQPSTQPSSEPSSQPSSQPSSGPSSQPSSEPSSGSSGFNELDLFKLDQEVRPQRDGGCFAAGTLVAVPDQKFKAIEHIAVGDVVLAYEVASGTVVPSPVMAVFQYPPRPGLSIRVASVAVDIRATESHPFLLNGEWRVVGAAKVGDVCLLRDGDESVMTSKPILSIERHSSIGPVFNIEVAHAHTFLVHGVVVHNKQMAGESTFDASGLA